MSKYILGFALVLSYVFRFTQAAAQDFAKWEPEMAAFAQADKDNKPKKKV